MKDFGRFLLYLGVGCSRGRGGRYFRGGIAGAKIEVGGVEYICRRGWEGKK